MGVKIRVEFDLDPQQFRELWQAGVGLLVRENPRLAYNQREKVQAARLAAAHIVERHVAEYTTTTIQARESK